MAKRKGEMIKAMRGLRDYLIAGEVFFPGSDLNVFFRYWTDRALGEYRYGKTVWSAAYNWDYLPKTAAAKALGRNGGQTLEHAVPVNVLFKAFKAAETDADFQAVIDAYTVTIVTREEDKAIRSAYRGAVKHMPEGWKIGDDPLARYRLAGVNPKEIE
jgi:hypothetical protein